MRISKTIAIHEQGAHHGANGFAEALECYKEARDHVFKLFYVVFVGELLIFFDGVQHLG